MKKKILAAVLAATMVMGTSMTSFAAGWQQNSTGWWYGTNADNSTWYSNGWQWIDGKCYYFDGNGNAVKGMVNINGQNLLFDNDGKQVKGHLVRVNGVIRYYDPNSGEMAVNRWVEISSGWWIYFDGEGRGQI